MYCERAGVTTIMTLAPFLSVVYKVHHDNVRSHVWCMYSGQAMLVLDSSIAAQGLNKVTLHDLLG